jgi:hypothetical protein
MLRAMWNNQQDPPVTADPVIQEKNGMVTISVKTTGASIGYKILSEQNSEGKPWKVYQSPFKISKGAKLKVVAQRIGYTKSNEVRFEKY